MPSASQERSRRRRSAKHRAGGEAKDARPAGRPVWSGSISFGLVTVPVELVSATRRARPALRMLGPSGKPLRREYVCPKDGKALRDDEIERGYEIAEGKFVLVTDEELERLAPRSSRDIELARFVDRRSIDPSYFVRSYFVVPSGGQTKAYRLLAEVMEETDRAAVAHFVMREKGYAVAIFAQNGILRAETLRFRDEVRRPEDLDLPKPGRVERLRLRKAQAAIRKLAATSVPERELADPSAVRLLALARKKYERGEDVVRVPSAPEPGEEGTGEVIDLIAALKKRLGQKRGASARTGARAKAARQPARAARRTRRSPSPGAGRKKAGRLPRRRSPRTAK